MEAFKVFIDILTLQGFVAGIGQIVRVVITDQYDQGIIELSCFFKPFQQISHRLFKLVVCGQVAFGGSRHALFKLGSHRGNISCDHDVVGRVVSMSRESHVVGAEALVIDVVIDGLFHHLVIGGRPGRRELHAVIHEFAFKAHVRQCLVPSVVIAQVIVISPWLNVFGKMEGIA